MHYDHVKAYTHPEYRERLLRFIEGTEAFDQDGLRSDAV